jgi:hypothetical protein
VGALPETQVGAKHKVLGQLTNRHARNPHPFLHNLQPNDKLDATPNMQITRSSSRNHRKVRRIKLPRPLQLGDIADVLKLCLCRDSVTAQAAEDIPRFLLTAHLDEPPRGLGEEPYRNKEDYQREDLERNGESPAEGGIATVDE